VESATEVPLKPTLAEVIRLAVESWGRDIHTALPGRVVKYDAAKQVADVLPVIKDARPDSDGDTQHFDIPVIPNVPVQWPRGGQHALHLPLAKGDHVLLVFQESAIGQWRETGDVEEPVDLARFDISYPIAIPGIAPNANPIADPGSDTEAVLSVGDGTFRVGGASAEMVAIAKLVQQALDKIQQKFDAHTHIYSPGPSAPAPTAPPPTPQLIGSLGPVAATKLKSE
jgi:Phage protein Gp138 N-terminal domain